MIQDGAAQRCGKMRQEHFVKIAVLKEIDFGIAADVFDQLLHLISQARIKAFVKKIAVQVTEEITQQISEEDDFADRVQLLRVRRYFGKNLLRQIQKFLIDLTRIGILHQLAASRDAIHGNRQHQNQKLQFPVTQIGKARLDDFPHQFLSKQQLLLVDELQKETFFILQFRKVEEVVLVDLYSQNIGQ